MEVKQVSLFPNILTPMKPRIIDTGFLPEVGSKFGFSERYSSGKTSHTIHVWWARRPHSSMRLMNYAILQKDLKYSQDKILTDLLENPRINEEIKHGVLESYSQTPKLLDLFGGGGTIAIESSNIGASTYSIDSNELSVFIQNSHFAFMTKEGDNLVNLAQKVGFDLLKKLEVQTSDLFPRRKDEFAPIAYLWTYKIQCNNCDYSIILSKRPFLNKKKEPYIGFKLTNNVGSQGIEYVELAKSQLKSHTKKFLANGIHKTRLCPKCSTPQIDLSVKHSQDFPVSIVKTHSKISGKSYHEPNQDFYPSQEMMEQIEYDLDTHIQFKSIVQQEIPIWNGITNLTLYGINTYEELYTRRQRIVLKLTVVLLIEAFNDLSETHGKKIATLIITPLTALIDQLVDWNSRITMWISQNGQPGRAFSGPGVPMYWDFCEIDPLSKGPANLWGKLRRIISGLKSLPKSNSVLEVKHANAQDLPFQSGFFDVISTDPPYYDNIYYTILADFFYVWKYPVIQHFSTTDNPTRTSDKYELTASRQRVGEISHQKYSQDLKTALSEAERVLKDDGIFSFVYTHSSFLGWDAITYAFQNTGLFVTSVQPLNIERKQRPRSMNANSVDVCMIFVLRKITEIDFNKSEYSLENMAQLFADISLNLGKLGWSDYEIALTLFANGIGMLCNLKDRISELKRKNQIFEVEKLVQVYCPTFKLKMRKSL